MIRSAQSGHSGARFQCIVATVCLVLFGLPHGPVAAEVWVEDSFEDFADGRLDAGGQNLYVSRDGAIRTIHRFDLNQDGWIDLVFNSTHDTVTDLPVTLATAGSGEAISQSFLPIGGSQQVAIGDLNRDGHPDAVFCPNRGGVQMGRQFLSVLWGANDGWSGTRLTRALPVHGARRIAIADLNSDSWPDLVVLNGPAWQPGQPEGDIVRVYWGSDRGYLLTRRTDYGVDPAVDLGASDLNGDGAADVVVLGRAAVEVLWANGESAMPSTLDRSQKPLGDIRPTCLALAASTDDAALELFIGTSNGRVFRARAEAGSGIGALEPIEAANATHISAGDLDGDSRMDLVLTNFEPGRAAGGEAAAADPTAGQMLLIVWGNEGGTSNSRTSQVPLANVSATAIGDLNGDGHADIAAAVYQGNETFTTDSVILFGKGDRTFDSSSSELTTTGAAGVAIVPATGERPARAVFCNSVGGTLREEVPLQIYWGNEGGFDPTRQTTIPFTSGYESTAADFNLDGYVDLVELNSGHSGPLSVNDPTLGINVFWGSASGFDFERNRTVLREENLGTSNTADFDRDGYLDLVVGQFSPSRDAADTQLILYYGSADGFDPSRRVAVASPGRSISTVVADFNRDEWLDVAVSAMTAETARIFWGGSEGFTADRISEIALHSAIDAETADLNADGWSDLIVGAYADEITHEHDLGTHIFWGSPDGFQYWNAQWLPGLTPIGHCVADFDGDGYLDLFSPHYHATGMRESLPCYLFWGGPDGFDRTRRTDLTCDSADDALAADFNRDGKLDLAVVCHARDGSHHTVSRVFYNDGARFRSPAIQTLPTHGPHWMWQQDMGHILHRRWEQRYESSVYQFDAPHRMAELKFEAARPDGTQLRWFLRAAADESQLADQDWQPIEERASLSAGDRVLQYAVDFISDNGDRYPELNKVQITLSD